MRKPGAFDSKYRCLIAQQVAIADFSLLEEPICRCTACETGVLTSRATISGNYDADKLKRRVVSVVAGA